MNRVRGTLTNVAVKVPNGDSDEKLSEFYVEAQAAFEFDHPSILKCLGISR